MWPLLGGVRTLNLAGVLHITSGGVLYMVLACPGGVLNTVLPGPPISP